MKLNFSSRFGVAGLLFIAFAGNLVAEENGTLFQRCQLKNNDKGETSGSAKAGHDKDK